MDLNYLSSSIEDFLSLFSAAAYVMIDSFHGTVFSILFEMPFATYYRGDMNPRFKTLFDLLEFEDSYSNGDSIILGGNYLKTKKLLKTLIKKKQILF